MPETARQETHTVSVLVDNEPGVLARVIDSTNESFVFEIVGQTTKLNAFISLMQPLGLIDVARTGVVGIARGSDEF